jgi:acetate---CoA ligase (ADP-forming)
VDLPHPALRRDADRGAIVIPDRSARPPISLLFEAQSVAIIGASADPTKLGSSPLHAMRVLGFKGTISIVNPRYEELMGHRCYPSIAALPDGIEIAMIIVPAAAAVDAAEELAARGVRAIVMIPQGFGEAGPQGALLDRRLQALVAQGVAITGPNTNGLANIASGLALSLQPILQYEGRVRPGRISVVSQSGAMVSSLLARLGQCGLGIGKTVACGNELVLTVADYIDYLAEDPDTDAIVVYLETIRDLPALQAALRRARAAGKPVTAIKVGESESGQKATLSHTGAIAGAYRNTVAWLENEGVYVAEDLETLAILTECLVRYDWSDAAPAKPFVTSISGGYAALTADVMARLGLALEDPSPTCAARLEALPTQSHAVNPYDIAAQNALIPDIIDIFRADGFNQLLFGLVLLKPEINAQVTTMMIDAKARGMDKLFALVPHVDAAERERFNAAGILITENVPALLKALRSIEHHRKRQAVGAANDDARAPEIALPEAAGLIDEARSKAVIATAGIRAPASRVLPVAGGCVGIESLRRPLVMKGLSDRIAHKTEHGLVALGLRTDADIEAAWSRIVAALRIADPDADSILVEEMAAGGLEAIVGVQRDPMVGPVVVVGAGGILCELLDDAVVLVPPFSPAAVREALAGTRFGRLLAGYRGQRYDLAALAEAAATIGQIACAQTRLESLDINPVLVQPDDGGLIALDAKIVAGD